MPTWDSLIADFVFQSLSESSRRVYEHTYLLWSDFASKRGLHPLDLSFAHIRDFVNESSASKSTRQNRLSHIRKLLKVLAVLDSRYEKHYAQAVALLKVTRTDSDSSRKGHSKRALSAVELQFVLDAWRADSSAVGIRNNAMIRLLVFTGLRRSEVASLQWTDIDFEQATIEVRHGKGDKSRTVAIVDPTDATLQALLTLKQAQGMAITGTPYQTIFCRMTRGKSSTFAADEPTHDDTVLQVVKRTAFRAGIGHISPHDLRRTHITTGLTHGATVADMQAQAGHSNPATTLIYAQASDAVERRKRIKFTVS